MSIFLNQYLANAGLSKEMSLEEERKESAKIADAFLAGKSARGKRTHTDGKSVYLHNNKIAWHGDKGDVHMTHAGWGTTTTKERLNTIATRLGHGRPFYHKKHSLHHGDKEISDRDVVTLRRKGMNEGLDRHHKRFGKKFNIKPSDSDGASHWAEKPPKNWPSKEELEGRKKAVSDEVSKMTKEQIDEAWGIPDRKTPGTDTFEKSGSRHKIHPQYKNKDTILVTPKGYKGGGKVIRILKNKYDPKKYDLAEGKVADSWAGVGAYGKAAEPAKKSLSKEKVSFNPVAKDLRTSKYKKRVVSDKTKYSRKEKHKNLDEGRYKVKTREKHTDYGDPKYYEPDVTHREYDVYKGKAKVGSLRDNDYTTGLTGKLHNKDLPLEIDRYRKLPNGKKAKNLGDHLAAFVQSKTGKKWRKNVWRYSDKNKGKKYGLKDSGIKNEENVDEGLGATFIAAGMAGAAVSRIDKNAKAAIAQKKAGHKAMADVSQNAGRVKKGLVGEGGGLVAAGVGALALAGAANLVAGGKKKSSPVSKGVKSAGKVAAEETLDERKAEYNEPWDRPRAMSGLKKEKTVLVSPKGYRGSGKVKRIPKSQYDPKKHNLAEDQLDELSNKALDQYRWGAVKDIGKQTIDAIRNDDKKALKKAQNRQAGISKARLRMAYRKKETTEGYKPEAPGYEPTDVGVNITDGSDKPKKSNIKQRPIKGVYTKYLTKKGQKFSEEQLDEKAVSQSQQKLFGMALAMRRGESDRGSEKVASLAADLSQKKLRDFAKTKRKGLPDHVKKDKK